MQQQEQQQETLCPLCYSEQTSYFHTSSKSHGSRIYHKCANCCLIFVLPQFYLTESEEKDRYDTHDNNPNDEGYKKFLSIATNSLIPVLTDKSLKGLDFGCGPATALAQIMSENGFHSMSNYDLYFHNDQSVLDQQYDFVTCTEVVEHFYEPGKEWQLLDKLVTNGGWLCVMTGMNFEEKNFGTWWYIRDNTHVCFYQHQTMQWIASKYNWTVQFPHKNVALFQKR